jgi:hypothetical protein
MVADFNYSPLFQTVSLKQQLIADPAAVEGAAKKLRQPSSSMMIGQVPKRLV